MLVLALAVLATVHTSSLLLFSRGLLLSRASLSNTSVAVPVDEQLRPTHDKLVLLVVDALRADFVLPASSTRGDTEHPPKLSTPARLAREHPAHTFTSHLIADPPTTTLQRLGGLCAGSLPAFVDASSNFARSDSGSGALREDNWLFQAAVSQGKKLHFVGDDTWLAVFPSSDELAFEGKAVWHEAKPQDSFHVEDLDTVDNAVRDSLLPLIKGETGQEWDVAIAHVLGIDHAAHRFGPLHSEFARKMQDTDELIADIAQSLDKDTLFVVLGDHGMTDTGDHGGDSRPELDAALFMYQNPSRGSELTSGMRGMADDGVASALASIPALAGSDGDLVDSWTLDWPEAGLVREHRAVAQIDLVPTLSLLLGWPVPFSSLGLPIPELFYRSSAPTGATPSTPPRRATKNNLSLFGKPAKRDEEAIATRTPLQTLLHAHALVASQIDLFLRTYSRQHTASSSAVRSHLAELHFLYEVAASSLVGTGSGVPGNVQASDAERAARELDALVRLRRFSMRTRHVARSAWARFDLALIAMGLVTLAMSLPLAWSLYHAPGPVPLKRLLVRSAIGAFTGALVAVAGVAIRRFDSLSALFSITIGAELPCLLRLPRPRGRWSISAIVPLALHCAMLASNSFTVWEDAGVLYLAASLALLSLYRGLGAPQKSLKWRVVGFSAAAVVLLRLMAMSTVCREEQRPSCSPTIALAPALALIASAACSILIPTALLRALARAKSDQGPARFVLGVFTRALLLMATGYWACDYGIAAGAQNTALLTTLKTVLARSTLVGAIMGAALVWRFAPPCVRVDKNVKYDSNGNARTTAVTLTGFGNVLGATYTVWLALLFVVLYLVNAPMGQVVLSAQLGVTLCLLEAFDAQRDADHLVALFASPAGLELLMSPDAELPPAPPHEGPTFAQLSLLALVAQLAFFATGHQATFSTIQWSSAFVGFPKLTYPFSPVLVVLNTLAPHVLAALAVPLFCMWAISPPLASERPLALAGSLLRAATGLMAYFGVLALASAVCATHLRRHLMVWKIFAPRFMLAAVTVLAVDWTLVLLAVGLGAIAVVQKTRRAFGTRFA